MPNTNPHRKHHNLFLPSYPPLPSFFFFKSKKSSRWSQWSIKGDWLAERLKLTSCHLPKPPLNESGFRGTFIFNGPKAGVAPKIHFDYNFSCRWWCNSHYCKELLHGNFLWCLMVVVGCVCGWGLLYHSLNSK